MNDKMIPNREYWCFISYRHADNKQSGRQWATWLHVTLETYEVPIDLIGKQNDRGDVIPDRIYPVFRDEEELPADAALSKPIKQAVTNSKFMVVLCSPHAVVSRFVAEEITLFKTHRPENKDRILAAIVAGDPAGEEVLDIEEKSDIPYGLRQCFPRPLRFAVAPDGSFTDEPTEPIAPDFRLPDGSEGYTSPAAYRERLGGSANAPAIAQFEKRMELMKLKIIAGILGIPLGILTARDKAYQLEKERQRARTLRRWLAAVAVLTLFAVIGGALAWQQRGIARERQGQAEASEEKARKKQKEAEASDAKAHEHLISASLVDLAAAKRSETPEEKALLLARALKYAPDNEVAARQLVDIVVETNPHTIFSAEHLLEAEAYDPVSNSIFAGVGGELFQFNLPWQTQGIWPELTESFTGVRAMGVRAWDGLLNKKGGLDAQQFENKETGVIRVRQDGKLAVMSVGSRIGFFDLTQEPEGVPSFQFELKDTVTDIEFIPDQAFLAVGALDGSITVYDVARKTSVFYREENATGATEYRVADLSFSPDGRLLGAATMDLTTGQGKLRVWDWKTSSEPSWSLDAGDGVVRANFVSNEEIFCERMNGTAELRNTRTGKGKVFRDLNIIGPAKWNPGKSMVALSTQSPSGAWYSCDVWRKADLEKPHARIFHNGTLLSLDWHPSGELIATASLDKTVKISSVDPESEYLPTELHHNHPVIQVAFSPDGRWLLTVSSISKDGTILHLAEGEREYNLWNFNGLRTTKLTVSPPKNTEEKEVLITWSRATLSWESTNHVARWKASPDALASQGTQKAPSFTKDGRYLGCPVGEFYMFLPLICRMEQDGLDFVPGRLELKNREGRSITLVEEENDSGDFHALETGRLNELFRAKTFISNPRQAIGANGLNSLLFIDDDSSSVGFSVNTPGQPEMSYRMLRAKLQDSGNLGDQCFYLEVEEWKPGLNEPTDHYLLIVSAKAPENFQHALFTLEKEPTGMNRVASLLDLVGPIAGGDFVSANSVPALAKFGIVGFGKLKPGQNVRAGGAGFGKLILYGDGMVDIYETPGLSVVKHCSLTATGKPLDSEDAPQAAPSPSSFQPPLMSAECLVSKDGRQIVFYKTWNSNLHLIDLETLEQTNQQAPGSIQSVMFGEGTAPSLYVQCFDDKSYLRSLDGSWEGPFRDADWPSRKLSQPVPPGASVLGYLVASREIEGLEMSGLSYDGNAITVSPDVPPDWSKFIQWALADPAFRSRSLWEKTNECMKGMREIQRDRRERLYATEGGSSYREKEGSLRIFLEKPWHPLPLLQNIRVAENRSVNLAFYRAIAVDRLLRLQPKLDASEWREVAIGGCLELIRGGAYAEAEVIMAELKKTSPDRRAVDELSNYLLTMQGKNPDQESMKGSFTVLDEADALAAARACATLDRASLLNSWLAWIRTEMNLEKFSLLKTGFCYLSILNKKLNGIEPQDSDSRGLNSDEDLLLRRLLTAPESSRQLNDVISEMRQKDSKHLERLESADVTVPDLLKAEARQILAREGINLSAASEEYEIGWREAFNLPASERLSRLEKIAAKTDLLPDKAIFDDFIRRHDILSHKLAAVDWDLIMRLGLGHYLSSPTQDPEILATVSEMLLYRDNVPLFVWHRITAATAQAARTPGRLQSLLVGMALKSSVLAEEPIVTQSLRDEFKKLVETNEAVALSALESLLMENKYQPALDLLVTKTAYAKREILSFTLQKAALLYKTGKKVEAIAAVQELAKTHEIPTVYRIREILSSKAFVGIVTELLEEWERLH